MKKFTQGILIGILVLFLKPVSAQNVWTQHNDQARTGWYPYETTLTTSNVNVNTFGLNFTHTTDDKIVAQPLVIKNVAIPSVGTKNIVYVATQNNTIYAYDADINVAAYWTVNYSSKIAPNGTNCGNCRPPQPNEMHPSLCGGGYGDFHENMGIISTPVVDTAAGIMYFVTKIVNPNDGTIDNHSYQSNVKDEYNYTTTGFHQYLHAIDIKTGAEKSYSPVEITATVSGTGDGAVGGQIKFDARRQFSRAGLVLSQGKIYIAYAAHCDFNPCHGWVISYNASNLNFVKAYNTTPNDGRGGIWMSGVAPAVDESGNLYVATGNSLNEDRTDPNYNTYNASPSNAVNRGESIIKLAPDLSISSYWTPWNYVALNDADLDFGTQTLLLPNTNIVMTGSKYGFLYMMNRGNLGGYNTTFNAVLQEVYVQNGATMHSTLAYFGGPTPYAYQYSENSPLKAYPVSTSGLGTEIVNSSMAGPSGSAGGYLSVSSNGADPGTGIVWAYQAVNGCDANQSNCPGILHAVNANNIKSELWNSSMVTGDKLNGFNKFVCPTVALGKVYVPANTNQLVVYGTKADVTCVTNVAPGKTAVALTNNGAAGNVIDGNAGTVWTGTAANVDSIYIDLGFSYDICKVGINWNGSKYGKDYDLKYSQDGVNWNTLQSVRGNSSTTNQYSASVTARYVNMRGIASGSGSGYSISEFQIFGSPSASCSAPTNLIAVPASTTTIFTNQVPAQSTDNDHSSLGGMEVGLKFRSSVAGNITGIRFYKTAGNTGTHIGELYTAGGTRKAQATFTSETATGWQTVNFSSPVPITANTTYVAAYYSSLGNYVETDFYFANALTNGSLTALKDGTDGLNAPFKYAGNATFPDQNYNQANYWVDVLFSTGAASNSETLSWNAISGVTQYLIKYRPNLSSSWISRTSNTNSITLSALTCGALYLYTVQAVCGASQSAISSGSFTAPACSGGPTCDLLPTRFFSTDIGDIGVAGSTCRNSEVYNINGSGTDIGSNGDQFQFVYTNGNDINDYDVYGKITAQTAANSSSKVGIMVRDSISNTSKFAYVAFETNKFIFEYRSQAGGAASVVAVPGAFTLPYYVKISKTGTTYSGFISQNGTSWTAVGSQNLNFGTDPNNTPHYGMAVTSANNTVLSSGSIEGFTLVTAGSSPVTANAGSDQSINLPASSVTLNGSGSSGIITSYQWSKISGPNTPTITAPTSSSTTVTGLIQGVYVFQLSVNSGASTSQVTITVNSAAGSTNSIFTTQTPVATTDNDNQASVGHEVGLRFRSSTAGFITGIKFYKTSGLSGTHIGELYTNSGTRLAQATFTGESGTGWQTVSFSSPVAINANTTYMAALYSSTGYYVEDNNYFSNAGVTNGNLTALKDGVDGCNGPYLYTGTPAFPNACYLSANYWVDVVYSGSTGPTANAGTNQTISLPTSSVTLDGTGSSGSISSYAWTELSGPNAAVINAPAAVTTSVTGLIQGNYTFQLSVNGGVSTSQVIITVNAATPPVANAGSNQTITLPVSTVTLSGSGSSGSITSYLWTRVSGPNTPVITTPNSVTTTVTGLVQGSYIFQLSLNGGVSTSQVMITVNAAVSSSTIFTNQTPVANTDNDNQPSVGHEVGLRFRSTTAGYITGVRFYKTTGNSGTHIGELYTNGGVRLAQATFVGETANGWQTVSFASPVAITANTTYMAALFSSAGFYVEDNNYFATTGVTNGNLTALKDGVDGCNGPYQYTASPVFPTACYLAANYWVDPIYSSSGTGPTQAGSSISAFATEQENQDSINNIKLTYFLSQNYPNPAAQNTRIEYGISRNSKVQITLSDITGRQIRVLVNETLKAGTYYYELNTGGLSKGVYFYKMQSGSFSDVKRMIVP